MNSIKSFSDLINHLNERESRKRIVVVWAADDHTTQACARALDCGFADFIFVGCKQYVESQLHGHADGAHVKFVDAGSPVDAAVKAVAMVRNDEADALMKGLINTDDLLHAVLNKQTGILPSGKVLTHITIADIPQYDRLLLFSDPAVIPYPTQEQRIEQIKYMATICSALGITQPKISLIHCTEKTNTKIFPFTADYAAIKEMAGEGKFGNVIVDGPLDLKTSCDLESMKEKNINSPIAGKADALIFPDIEAGNVFYKTITLFCGAQTAGLLQGTKAPVVLSSRADTPESKFYSLAIASI